MDASSFFRYDQEHPPADEIVFLDGATEVDWQRLAGAGSRQRFRAGDVVVAQGDDDRSLMIVLDGRLQTVIGSGRKQRRLSTIGAGSVLGELGFLDGAPRSASVVAETDVEVLRLEFEDFLVLSRAHTDLTFRVLLDLSRILAMRMRRLTDVVAGDKR